jgi:flagellar biosynthesis GTPase FlhF
MTMKRKAAEEEAAEKRVAEQRERTMRALQNKVREEQHQMQLAEAKEVEAVFIIWRQPPVRLGVRPAHYAKVGQIWVKSDTQKWVQEVKGFGPEKAVVCLSRDPESRHFFTNMLNSSWRTSSCLLQCD